MKNKHGNLKCSNCGCYDLEMHVDFDGVDDEAEKGNGFDYEISLVCNNCGRGYPVARTNNEFAISAIKDKKQ